MAGRVPDLLEVVVLPAGPHTLLAGDRPGVVAAFQTLKHALELHHPGVGEEQGGVIGGDQQRARHLAVGARCSLEVVDELAADVSGLHGCKI